MTEDAPKARTHQVDREKAGCGMASSALSSGSSNSCGRECGIGNADRPQCDVCPGGLRLISGR